MSIDIRKQLEVHTLKMLHIKLGNTAKAYSEGILHRKMLSLVKIKG